MNTNATLSTFLFLSFFLWGSMAYGAVDWVGNMFPTSGSDNTTVDGENFTIYIQAFKSGTTEPAGQGAGITCEIYYGDVSVFGQPWMNVFTQAMSYNVDIGNNDEYVGIIAPPAGLYEFTCRCSDDGGASWTFATLPNGNGRLTVNMALAVDLLQFNAASEANEIHLNWSTAIEQNHSHFDVERSADSYNWERIGRIDGQGNSTSRQDYLFEDQAPLLGMNYYRLNQIDWDGQSTKSKVLAVEHGQQQQWTVAPNPVGNQLYLQSDDLDDQGPVTHLIRLFDGKGTLVRSLEQEGISHLEIDFTDLHSGLYLLTITNLNKQSLVLQERILKK